MPFILNLFKNRHALSLLTQVAGAFLGFISFLILVRLLQKADFGSWALYMTCAGFLGMLRTGLVKPALIRFAAYKEADNHDATVGSGWLLTICITTILVLGVLVTGFFLNQFSVPSEFTLLFTWWPVLALVSLPSQYATWLQHAYQRFDRMLVLRILVNGSFSTALLAGFLFYSPTLTDVIYIHLAANLAASLVALLLNWSRVLCSLKATRQSVSELFSFGKYSALTMLGARVLKNSDTILIGAFLGPIAVAMYSVPQKLLEAIEIPLRGLSATAYPMMSRHCLRGDEQGMARIMIRMMGALTIGFIPFLAIAFIFAEPLVVLVGGPEYADSVTIFRIFLLFAALLPLDRFMGIALDSLNKPRLNTVKIISMIVLNLAGNMAVIHLIGSPEAVATITVVTTMLGVYIGKRQLSPYVTFPWKRVLQSGWRQCLQIKKLHLTFRGNL